MTRTDAKRTMPEARGVLPVVCDVYDLEALRAAVVDSMPDAAVISSPTCPATPRRSAPRPCSRTSP
jgi:hypothetical protein